MIGKLMTLGAIAALWAAGQGNLRDAILARFPDGAGVELYTETTGSTQQTSVQGGGMIWYDLVYRFVMDSQDKTVFAYELEAERAAEPGAVTIRIKPVSPEVAANSSAKSPLRAGAVPTVSAVREFRSVKKGQEVKIEILANPATGERVYDVLRPTEASMSPPHRMSIQAVKRTVSGGAAAQEVRVVVNGEAGVARSSWTAGKPARLYLPGHGAYYLSFENLPRFRLAGYAEKNRLVFLMDRDYVEITCGSNILTTAERGPVWVYYDPHYAPPPQEVTAGEAELTVAGNLEGPDAKK